MAILLKTSLFWLILVGASTGWQASDAHSNTVRKVSRTQAIDCSKVSEFTDDIRKEIHSHASDVDRIIDLVLNGKERGSTYNELAYLCDTYGPRMSGTHSLESGINHMKHKMQSSNLDNVHSESAMIPKWEINEQWAVLTRPIEHRMSILALGYSVGTNGTIEAEVQLVHSFDELAKLAASGLIHGKIVVFNYNFTTYGESVKFRTQGALQAAKYGAAAALVRSVTPFSINSPHAGAGSRSIPTAAIAVEDADLIERWHKRNKRIVIKLNIDSKNYPDVESSNTIGDITGSEKPEQIVLVSGHVDSWYNTQGAMDDGGGMMISYKALDVLRKLNLRAKRTVRAVLWVAEEFGLIGAQQYLKDHKHELKNFKVVMESDLGTFTPLGLSVTNLSPLGECVVAEVLKLTDRINTTKLDYSYEGSDIEVFSDLGVPGISLYNDNSKYFYFHHTSGDAMTIENPDALDKSTILWAAASYVIADLSVDIGDKTY